ncbi:MAG: tail assembly chaperone [Blautia sp.]|nr:tail assembly chaperone [Blautia sp.]
MELTIKEQVYQFNFGMGFLREMNRKVTVPVDGIKDVKRNIGLRYTVSGIMDGDVEALEELLVAANKDQAPRVTTALLDEYIDDPETDIDQLFEDVLGFLKNANATKKCLQEIEKAIEEEKAKQEAAKK